MCHPKTGFTEWVIARPERDTVCAWPLRAYCHRKQENRPNCWGQGKKLWMLTFKSKVKTMFSYFIWIRVLDEQESFSCAQSCDAADPNPFIMKTPVSQYTAPCMFTYNTYNMLRPSSVMYKHTIKDKSTRQFKVQLYKLYLCRKSAKCTFLDVA